jgi:hypothetical protein
MERIAVRPNTALPGFQQARQRAGLSVPREFSIIGVAARHWAEEFHPQLTAADLVARQHWPGTRDTSGWPRRA